MEINERIRYLRKDILKITQQEFSAAINISRSNMGNIETGNVAVTDRVVQSICEKFDINKEWLINGVGDIKKEMLPLDEVALYTEELLGSEDNPFFDMIIAMMKTYHELDRTSQQVMLDFFRKAKENLQKKEGG